MNKEEVVLYFSEVSRCQLCGCYLIKGKHFDIIGDSVKLENGEVLKIDKNKNKKVFANWLQSYYNW